MAKDPNEQLTNTHEGLETVNDDQIKEMKEVVSETEHPIEDPVTGAPKEPETPQEPNDLEHHRQKVTRDAEKDLLFHTANTWENMDEVPE